MNIQYTESSTGEIKRVASLGKEEVPWGPGEWDNEPDKLVWYDGEFAMMIHRNHMGALCGYVGVPEGHWAFERAYSNHGDDYEDFNFHVHGGLTYSDHCAGVICHTPKEGEPRRWWLGFDCGHGSDLMPGMVARGQLFNHGIYRNVEYVTKECESLALQLRDNEEK